MLGRGRGLGKLILLGEHSVVYGHRALAASVSLGTTVTLHSAPGPTRLGRSAIRDDRLGRALAVALPADGLAVDIATELPVGCGMGSSAALTVALLRARAAADGRTLDAATLHRQGFEVERIFHGNPSGLDHAVAALGGALVYRKGEEPERVALPTLEVVVLDSGSAGDTASLVAGVANRRPGIDPALDRLGALVERAVVDLSDEDTLMGCMNEAHVRLREIGVSTPRLDELVELATSAGAKAAKLSGAGGGGVVVAVVDAGDERVEQAARARGIRAFRCTVPGSASRG